jgi:hypothetical protein
MLMIPARTPVDHAIEFPDGPQLLAARLWSRDAAPENIREQLTAWKETAQGPIYNASTALMAISWAHALPSLQKVLAEQDWSAFAAELSNWTAADPAMVEEQPLVHQLLAGELAWTLATRAPKSPFSRGLERNGRMAISLGMSKILDGQGMLRAEHFDILRSLLACWLRCRTVAAELPRNVWAARMQRQYQKFVRNALRCARPDGQPMMVRHADSGQAPRPWGSELFAAVFRSDSDEIDRSLLAIALPALPTGIAGRPPKKSAHLPPPSIYREDGAVAVFRRDWTREDERIAVLFPGQKCELELVSSGRVAVAGQWQFEISQQGQPLVPASNWESVCHYCDEDVEYLELEIELSGGVQLQRQIVLALEDRFLLLADAVLSSRTGELAYRSVLPLASGVEFRPAKESREGLLAFGPTSRAGGKASTSARPLAQVLPLAMPEWRAEQSVCELKATEGGLGLWQSTSGHRLFAPLFIDLDRGRFRRRMTWRRLTIAEGLTVVPSETAVGFRVAIGLQQWIFYRSLAIRSNRTLLGHNLSTESLIARFDKNGEVTPIVEIE